MSMPIFCRETQRKTTKRLKLQVWSTLDCTTPKTWKAFLGSLSGWNSLRRRLESSDCKWKTWSENRECFRTSNGWPLSNAKQRKSTTWKNNWRQIAHYGNSWPKVKNVKKSWSKNSNGHKKKSRRRTRFSSSWETSWSTSSLRSTSSWTLRRRRWSGSISSRTCQSKWSWCRASILIRCSAAWDKRKNSSSNSKLRRRTAQR